MTSSPCQPTPRWQTRWRSRSRRVTGASPSTTEESIESSGFVRLRDLAAPTVDPAGPVGELRRDALRVPSTIAVVELLKLMQQRRIHLAVVVERGATVGIVTIEDLAEELVGSIDED